MIAIWYVDDNVGSLTVVTSTGLKTLIPLAIKPKYLGTKVLEEITNIPRRLS